MGTALKAIYIENEVGNVIMLHVAPHESGIVR